MTSAGIDVLEGTKVGAGVLVGTGVSVGGGISVGVTDGGGGTVGGIVVGLTGADCAQAVVRRRANNIRK